jgi:pimeloyl-ACP methyl ester carboxylesterase
MKGKVMVIPKGLVLILITFVFLICNPLKKIVGPAIDTSTIIRKDYLEHINGANLYFHVQTFDPKKPYILYLNGGPGDVSVRGRAIFETIGINRNVIFLDQRACGRSERDVAKDAFLFTNLVADIDRVLDHLRLDKVIILGHSWGGVYGLKYALARPNRVITLISISAVDSWDRALDRYYQKATKYAKNSIALVKKLIQSKKPQISQENIISLRRFCGFMAQHNQKAKNNIYKLCLESPNLMDPKKTLQELEDDLLELNKYRDAKNRWPGWSARGIRRKYGLYSYAPGCDRYCEIVKQKVTEMYTKDQLEYSKTMEKGLWINDDWSNYDMMNDLPGLKTNFYYLYGKYDHLFASSEIIKWVQDKYGEAHVIMFDKAGHSPMMENPIEFKHVIHRLYENP